MKTKGSDGEWRKNVIQKLPSWRAGDFSGGAC
jgi:hypothetical protein